MKKISLLFLIVIIAFGCATDPMSGKKTMALIPNSQLFPMAFSQYDEFLKENTVVKGTPDAIMVNRVGVKLAEAAQKLLTSQGQPNYFKDYKWEFTLVKDDAINAWAMPGGKIVFYTGILPITKNEAGIAVVMGHEIAHAILNHGQQRMSGGVVQQIGALGVSVATAGQSPAAQKLIMGAYGVSTEVGGTLPFSRKHEHEADKYGLILMAIAGYHPSEGALLWERMSKAGGGGVPEFLSTHPSDSSRIKNLRKLEPEAIKKAAEFGVKF